MTPQEINIEIAKVCGWTLFEHECGLWSGLHNGTYIRYKCGVSENHAKIVCFPDYHDDLNAMHEAENVLDSNQLVNYCRQLQTICGDWKLDAIRATAAQRAEAFLRTLNLWR